jgi:hypothetical protein
VWPNLKAISANYFQRFLLERKELLRRKKSLEIGRNSYFKPPKKSHGLLKKLSILPLIEFQISTEKET